MSMNPETKIVHQRLTVLELAESLGNMAGGIPLGSAGFSLESVQVPENSTLCRDCSVSPK